MEPGALGSDHTEGLAVDLNQIDFEKLRNELASKVQRKHAALQDIRDAVEKKLAQMLIRNPLRMDYYKKYQEIIADYNREKDRATVEATFAQLVALTATLDAERNVTTQAEIRIFILDRLYESLPHPPFTDAETENIASRVYDYVWQRSASGKDLAAVQPCVREWHDGRENQYTRGCCGK